MVYEMMRTMAGPHICSMVDSYIAYQDIFNSIVVVGGLTWRVYKKKYWKDISKKEKQKENFFEFNP